MQNEIYGSLVTIQYHTKYTEPLYPKFTSKIFSVYIFAATFTWSLHMFYLSPQTSVHAHLSVIAPNNVTTSSTKMHRYGIPQPIWQQIGSKTLTYTTKLGLIPLADTINDFGASHYGIQTIKWISIISECLWHFSIEGCTIWTCAVLLSLKRDLNLTFISIVDIWKYEMHAL